MLPWPSTCVLHRLSLGQCQHSRQDRLRNTSKLHTRFKVAQTDWTFHSIADLLFYCTIPPHTPKLMFFAMAKCSLSSASKPHDSAASSVASSLLQDLFRLDLLSCSLLLASRDFPRAVPLALEPRVPWVDFADPPRLGSTTDRTCQHCWLSWT